MYSLDSATISLLDIIKKKPVQLVENIFIPLEKKIKIWKMLVIVISNNQWDRKILVGQSTLLPDPEEHLRVRTL